MRITIYCGASLGNQPIYQDSAIALGRWMAQKQHTLVYGGGRVGLMGTIADTLIQAKVYTIGIIPTFLKEREIAHQGLDQLIVVDSMTERKAKMIELGEAFIALPGGPGTLEEISEVISWARIGQNNKPCILFNVNGYYDHLAKLFDHMVAEGFLTQADRSKILVSDQIDQIEDFITNYQAPIIRSYE